MNIFRIALLSIAVPIIVSCIGQANVLEISSGVNDRVCSATIGRSGWMAQSEYVYVEVSAECDGWWLDVFIRSSTCKDALQDGIEPDLDVVVFWNSHVFPFKRCGLPNEQQLRVSLKDDKIILKGTMSVQIHDCTEHANHIGGLNEIKIKYDLNIPKILAKNTMLLNSKHSESSETLQQWKAMLMRNIEVSDGIRDE